jgi:hypothetical protein
LNIEEIIAQIDEEISKLQQAKAVLVDVANVGVRQKVGRPKKSSTASKRLSVDPVKRTMSAEGKAKIAEAQRKRWAKKRRSDKKATQASVVKTVTKAAKPMKKPSAKKSVKSTSAKAAASIE